MRDSGAGGKVNTVITVTIGSAGGVKQGAETLNTSETAERLQQDLHKLTTYAAGIQTRKLIKINITCGNHRIAKITT